MNPNDYQRCWTVGEYVWAQTASSLVWIALLGLGGLALMLLRKRIAPFLLKSEPIPRLPDGKTRVYVAKHLEGGPKLVVFLTEDLPVQIVAHDVDSVVDGVSGLDGNSSVAVLRSKSVNSPPSAPVQGERKRT